MAAPPIRKSKLSITQQENIRKAHSKSSRFDPSWIGEGGPIEIYQSCGFVTDDYRNHYEDINWR